jgi:hypothetical protein
MIPQLRFAVHFPLPRLFLRCVLAPVHLQGAAASGVAFHSVRNQDWLGKLGQLGYSRDTGSAAFFVQRDLGWSKRSDRDCLRRAWNTSLPLGGVLKPLLGVLPPLASGPQKVFSQDRRSALARHPRGLSCPGAPLILRRGSLREEIFCERLAEVAARAHESSQLDEALVLIASNERGRGRGLGAVMAPASLFCGYSSVT